MILRGGQCFSPQKIPSPVSDPDAAAAAPALAPSTPAPAFAFVSYLARPLDSVPTQDECTVQIYLHMAYMQIGSHVHSLWKGPTK